MFLTPIGCIRTYIHETISDIYRPFDSLPLYLNKKLHLTKVNRSDAEYGYGVQNEWEDAYGVQNWKKSEPRHFSYENQTSIHEIYWKVYVHLAQKRGRCQSFHDGQINVFFVKEIATFSNWILSSMNGK